MKRRYHKKDDCTGKYRYSAAHADLEIERAKTFRGEQLRKYWCRKCQHFHLTAMTSKFFKAMAGR